MLIRSLLGLAALLVATSCVPSRVAPDRPRPIAAITPSEETLLRGLALATPDIDRDTGPPATASLVPRAAAPPFVAISPHSDAAGRAVECLTAAVYYEARSEPVDGQRAVAQVVLNRVRDRAYPPSVCGVVYQRSARGCQFSFVCDGSTRLPIDPAAWARARAVATAGFGGAVYAPVGAATSYHTIAVSPWWAPSLARIGRIGAHVFYGWRRAMAAALTFRRSYAGIEPGAAPMAQVVPDDGPAVAGVTIHRGGTPPADTTAPIEASSSPADGIVMIAGVRIHRRAGPPGSTTAEASRVGPDEDEPTASADPI